MILIEAKRFKDILILAENTDLLKLCKTFHSYEEAVFFIDYYRSKRDKWRHIAFLSLCLSTSITTIAIFIHFI